MNGLYFRPVTAEEVDVRVQHFTKYSVSVLLYKDARVDQNILDETVGCFNWQRSHSRDNANCTVSIWDNEKKQWISKEDTGAESQSDKEKGLASDSFKRACFCWGIGRELYTSPFVNINREFVDIYTNKYGNEESNDKFFVQKMQVDVDQKTGIKLITQLVIGIDHKGQRDWVWAWDKATNRIVHNKPSWLSGNYNGYSTPITVSKDDSPSANAAADVPAKPKATKSWGNYRSYPNAQKTKPATKSWNAKN